MYMVKAKPRPKPKPPLRWRPNCIRFWREKRGLTLEEAAEALGRPPYEVTYTHNSLGRVENAKQMPTIALIEALAKLYDTDIDSLLNRRPAEAPNETAKGILYFWDQAESEERGLIFDLAKRLSKTGT